MERVWLVEVDVALRRPPRVDEQRWFAVVAQDRTEATLVACQLACTDERVVMPVGARVV